MYGRSIKPNRNVAELQDAETCVIHLRILSNFFRDDLILWLDVRCGPRPCVDHRKIPLDVHCLSQMYGYVYSMYQPGDTPLGQGPSKDRLLVLPGCLAWLMGAAKMYFGVRVEMGGGGSRVIWDTPLFSGLAFATS